MGEHTRADYEVAGAVELEEKELAWLERLELQASARLPEVDLVEVRARRQEPIPVVVRHAHEIAHAAPSSRF